MIDLISDTATQPSEGMREAMAAATVGDEQRGEDPTTNRLCKQVAEILGMEAALFLPTGIMCNLISLLVHCGRGDEVLVADTAHILRVEGGGIAHLVGALVTPIPSERGIFTADALRSAIQFKKVRAPQPRAVSIEQTTNRGGGAVWPVDAIRAIAGETKSSGLALHIDGARLLNAAVATGLAPSDFASVADSCWIDLSKGLGCPGGAVLAGSRDFVDRAWFFKHMVGGAGRQTGILAAAGLFALDHNIDRLANDHRNAELFASILRDSQHLDLAAPVETNIVFFELGPTTRHVDAHSIVTELSRRDIRIRAESRSKFRAITHLGIDEKQAKIAAQAVVDVVTEIGETQ